MAQGVDFRQSSGFVTDPTNYTSDITQGSNNYPTTTPQGVNVGWESGGAQISTRDRNSSLDPRIAGLAFTFGGTGSTYRIDLPSSGSYQVGLGAGDPAAGQIVDIDLYDTNTKLVTLSSGSISAGTVNDATNTNYSDAAWPGSQAMVTQTFSTTICRFKVDPAGTGNLVVICSVFVQAAAGGGVTVTPPAGSLTLSGQTPTVTATANQFVTPPAGSLSLSGKVPTVLTPNTIAVPAGSLSLTGLVPTVTIGTNITVSPPAGSLSLTGNAPTVAVSDNKTVAPPAGSLSLTGLVPTVAVTQNVLISVPLATLSLAALTPTVLGSAIIPDVTTPTPAGRSKRRYFVEIDGVSFPVESAEEARSILERAKTLARQAADESAQIIERTNRFTRTTIEPVKLPPPRIKASPELKLPLKSVRRSINKIYREKSIVLELRMWLELEQRLLEDDDEAMLLLQ